MSRAAADADMRKVGAFVQTACVWWGLIVPACGEPVGRRTHVATVIFGFRAGAGEASTYAGLVIMAFAVGLLPFSLFTRVAARLVLHRGHPDAVLSDRRLTRCSWWACPATVLPGVRAVQGPQRLALGYSLALLVHVRAAWFILSRRLQNVQVRQTASVLARLLVARVVPPSGSPPTWDCSGCSRRSWTTILFGFGGRPVLPSWQPS